MYVLEPLKQEELHKLFDDDAKNIIEYFIKKSVFSQPEKMVWQKDLPIQIPKEHIEQWITQALWIESKGAWSYAIDLLDSKNNWWADVKMLSAKVDKDWNLTNNDSWETSLAQKFKSTWVWLDNLFIEWKYQIIMEEWFWIYKAKLENVIEEHNLKNIYYFIILRWWDKLYLLWMEVFLENLWNCSVNNDRTSKDSVFIDNFIDSDLWNIKIYKAKKRMELRLKPKNWFDKNLTIEFPTELIVDEINFREFVKNWWNIENYWKTKADNFFKNWK